MGLIKLPAPIIAGRASVVPWTVAEWVAHEVPGARLEIFEQDEGGSHLLALENPTKFNQLVREFIDAAPTQLDQRILPGPSTTPNEAKGTIR
jgi:pimeloyl-ACP methyl ester carboxylesterase